MTAELVSVDIETKDPHLLTKGAGCRRGDGFIVGVAIGYLDSSGEIDSHYYPLNHPDSVNLSRELIIGRLQEIQKLGIPITGANLLYDFDWIEEELGVSFSRTNPWHDVQVLEPLLDENARSYSLQTLAVKYLKEGKDSTAMYRWAANKFGGAATAKAQAKNIWRMPAAIVKPYAISDVELPLRIHQFQMTSIKEQGLQRVAKMECGLQPLLLAMKRRGVRVDVEKCERMIEEFQEINNKLIKDMFDMTGSVVEIWSANSIAAAFDKQGLRYPLTPSGRPSFTGEWLVKQSHFLPNAVAQSRKLDKLINTFLSKAILGNELNGRIHCQFNQLKGDEYGTVTGRFSSSLPNLQQVPSRTNDGRRIRSCFIPEEGQRWGKLDYSQIEPRLLLSYITPKAAKPIVAAYAANPALDCYNNMLTRMPSWVKRADVKTIYLGATYGMGKDKMAANMGITVEEAEPHFTAFHEGAPYISKLSRTCAELAQNRGVISTLSGRKSRFEQWEPAYYLDGEDKQALSLSASVDAWPDRKLKRAFGYRALNRLIQGGAADIMKEAMVCCWEEGLFDDGMLPLLTVHDELDFSFEDEGKLRKVQEVMEWVYRDKLRVPMRVDVEAGPDWGSVKEI